jgi:hypothetical protein
MIFSGARRFGLLCARAGWWRWLIAALVASLVSVPLAGAAAPIERAPAVGAALARPAVVEGLAGRTAVALVQLLAKGAVSKAGSEGFGWVLGEFGLGNGLEGEIAGIRDQLGQIQNRLTALEEATTRLHKELAESTYSGLVAQTTPITARIDTGMNDLDAVANMAPGDPTKKAFTEERLNFIHNNLMQGEQQELAKRITGEAGADGLIVAASKVAEARAGCCWTAHTSDQVRQVFDTYQLYEAELLTLRVEYMHARRDTYSGSYIEAQIRTVEQELVKQEALLKPSAPCCASQFSGLALPGDQAPPKNGPSVLIASPRDNLIWNTAYLGVKMEYWEPDYLQRDGWRLATQREVLNFIQGWHGLNWAEWLYHLPQVGGRIPSLAGPDPTVFEGVWTFRCSLGVAGCHPTAVGPTGNAEQHFLGTKETKGVLLVKERTEEYWWK